MRVPLAGVFEMGLALNRLQKRLVIFVGGSEKGGSPALCSPMRVEYDTDLCYTEIWGNRSDKGSSCFKRRAFSGESLQIAEHLSRQKESALADREAPLVAPAVRTGTVR